MLTRFLRPRPDGGASGAAPVAAPAAAPAATPAIPMNDATGDAPIDRVIPQDADTPSDIASASRAMRERAAAAAAAAPAAAPGAEGTGEQPRNADGTFAPKPAVDGEQPAADAPITADVATDGSENDGDEPKLFVLKGEEQRGETDLELDITGLPPEAVERLERLAKQGMRAAEHKQAMQKVRTERADLDAVETEIRVDPAGFVLNRLAPATRAQIAETLLLEHWDTLAPTIEQLWEDDAGRSQRLGATRKSIEDRRTDVVNHVQAAREAAAVRTAVTDLIPDNVSEDEAQEFFATSIALLQQKAMSQEPVTVATVAKQLDAHRRRFFGAGDAAPSPTPPARPKLAVRAAPSPTPAAGAPLSPTPTPVARAIQQRAAASATAPMGAGTTQVQRPGPPANATVEEVSRYLRGQAKR